MSFKVAIYARVSTLASKKKDADDSPRQNPETQLQPLRAYCAARGWDIAAEYVDRMSGSKDHRPALDRLMKDATQRKIDGILVWKLDRFGRSLRNLINVLAELQALGVAFISLTDNLDMSTPAGRLMFHVIAAMAEFERDLIRERVVAGITRAKAEGKQLGRPCAIFSHDKAQKLRDNGASLREIAAKLGVSHVTVSNSLKSNN